MLKVQIHIKGKIDQDWSDWFEGLIITHISGEETLLSGALKDQAELYGTLARLWNLRLSLVSLEVIETQNEQ